MWDHLDSSLYLLSGDLCVPQVKAIQLPSPNLFPGGLQCTPKDLEDESFEKKAIRINKYILSVHVLKWQS